jgi:hypothetical protein
MPKPDIIDVNRSDAALGAILVADPDGDLPRRGRVDPGRRQLA